MKYLVGALSLFIMVQTASAAKVDSVNKKAVTLFLETVDDEDVKAGDIVYLVDKSGKRKATLKVVKNRGLMADATVIKGLSLIHI